MILSLTEQRGNAQRRDLEANREMRGGGYRENVHYYGDYGTTMTEDAFKAAENQRAQFNKEVAAKNKAIAKANSLVQQQEAAAMKGATEAYGEGMKSITESKPKSFSEYVSDPANTVGINVGDEHTYRLPPEAAHELAVKVADYNKNNPNDIGLWERDGGYYLDTKGYGKEWHEQLMSMENQFRDSYNTQVKIANMKREAAQGELSGQYESALSNITSQAGSAQSTLSANKQTLDMLVAERRKNLQKLKDRYKQKVAAGRSTISALTVGGNNE